MERLSSPARISDRGSRDRLAISEGNSIGVIQRPGASRTALSMRFSNSLTFPGHAYSIRIGIASEERPSMFLWSFLLKKINEVTHK